MTRNGNNGIIKALTPWAIYCPEHGLQFVTEKEYDSSVCRIDGCDNDCDRETILYQRATFEGCDFCKKKPLIKPFIYLPKSSEIYCHNSCYRCMKRICTHKSCEKQAEYLLYLHISTGEIGEASEEYLIPTAFCRVHRIAVPHIPNDSMWSFILSMMQKHLKREDCRLVLRKM